jgi:NADPH-dependent F420 reductase
MKIGIIGGTGDMGQGLALRWAPNHDVVIGSRDAGKAESVAKECYDKAVSYYSSINGSIKGDENLRLVKYCDAIVLCIPYESINTLESIADSVKKDSIVICPIVPMSKDSNGFIYSPMHEHKYSAAEQVRSIMPNTRVVAAFHNISDVKLRKLGTVIENDVLICADDKSIVEEISPLIKEIKNLRPLYVGPLSLSYQVESLTPLILNVARHNGLKNPGIKIL